MDEQRLNAYLELIQGLLSCRNGEELLQLLNENSELAAYQLALQVKTRDAFPQQWAMTQNNLGEAYRNRIKGEREENLEFTIKSSIRCAERNRCL